MNPLPNLSLATGDAACRTPDRPAVTLEDSRVIRAVEEYLASLETGPALDRQQLLARYPEIATALARCLDALEFVHRVAPQLSESGRGQAPVAAPAIHHEAPLGDFRLVREVGRGGMGVVYEAVQISLGRRVALKVLPFAATMDPKQLQRFKNEAQAAAHLHHTNIVPVFGVGCERGVHYYAMQFIEGQTLAHVIADLRAQQADLPRREDHHDEAPPSATGDYQPTRLVPQLEDSDPQSAMAPTRPIGALSTEHSIKSAAYFRAVANLGVQAAEALEHAHAQGVIHRDIKPANLLVDARANLWITDFGLAHCQTQPELTMSGDLVGTLRYMSPEQALAKRVLIDHRTDIYSLGVTLYELLTLEPAYTGSDRQELLRQIAFEQPRSPRRWNKPIPAELETIVQKAMEKNPAERYASAQDLADDLRRFLEDKPIRAKRPTLVQRAARWSRRHRSFVYSTAVIVLILASSLGWIVRDWQARRTEAENRVTEALAVAEEKLHEGNPQDPELISAARRAEAHLASGMVREKLKQRVEQVLADLAMLAKLEEIRLVAAASTAHGLQFDAAAADLAYARAFREYGIDMEALGAEAVAARIRQRPIGLHLTVALDDWAQKRIWLEQTNAKQPPQGPRWQQLLHIAQSADPDPWRSSLREALAKGRKSSADLKRLLVSAPIPALAPSTLDLSGRALRDAGAGTSAVDLLRQAQRVYPDDFWINQNLALLLAEMKPPRLEEAIGFYRAALAIRPKSDGVYNNLGSAFGRQPNLLEAEAAYRKATELEPDHALGYNNLGSVLDRQGKLREAEAAFRKAIELKADYAMAYCNLGGVLRNQHKLPEAEAACRKAIELNPDYADAYHSLGLCLVSEQKLLEAVAAYRKAIELQPDFAGAYLSLGYALVHQGKVPEAEAAWRKAIELKPDYAAAYRNLGILLGTQHKLPEAEASCRKAIELEPENANAYYCLGIVLEDRGKLPEAEAAFRKAVELKPDYANAYYALAHALDHQRKLPEADAAYRKAIELKPDYAEAHCNLGGVLRQQGQFAESLACYKRGHDLGSRKQGWQYPSGEWVLQAERFVLLQPKLPKILKGEILPADATESVALAEWAGYSAARAAALAGSGQHKDAANLEGKEYARLRGQALAGLRIALAAWQKTLDTDSDRELARVMFEMRRWQRDEDFNDVRGAVALAKLPDSERQDWQNLWEEVANLARRAGREAHGFMRDWLVLSEPLPFESRNGAKALDEQQIPGEGHTRPRAGDRVQAGGKSLVWKNHHAKDFRIDFVALYGPPSEFKLTYAVCYVHVDADRTDLVLRVGSDDQAKVYINGIEVYRQPKVRGLDEEDVVKNIALRKGSNVIVFKVVNEKEGWEGCLRFAEKDGHPVKGIRFGLEPE